MENFREWSPPAFDILVGGTPCQSFSVAGLRAGLDDPRGNLALVYLAIAERFRPEWLVWENVPGAFSSDSHEAPDPRPPIGNLGLAEGDERVEFDEYQAVESHAFACFLAGLQKLGYGFAYRTLDAQHFGVPQRRRRIFLVANSRGWGRAAAVLFERESLRRHPPPSRETGEEIAGTLGGRTAGGGRTDDLDTHEAYVPEISPAVTAKWAKRSGGPAGDESQNLIADPITAQEGRMTSHGGNNPRPHNLVACLDETQVTHPENRSTCAPHAAALASHARPPAIAFDQDPVLLTQMAVRRLTPRECERLMGLQDDYTAVDYRGKPLSDSARYRLIGNAIVRECLEFIGRRIKLLVELVP